MTEDVNEQVEAEEMDMEAEGAAPRCKRGGFWAVTTLVFVVATAVLAWLYTVQLDELAALRTKADQAGGQVIRLQQANRQVSAKLAELMDKLREVVKVVDELEGVEELQPTAEEAAAEGKEPAAAAEPAEAPEPEPAAKAEPAEEAKAAEQQRPGPRVPRVPPRR